MILDPEEAQNLKQDRHFRAFTARVAPPIHVTLAKAGLVPFQAFPARDGWVVVACPKEKFWVRLTVVLGRPELAVDERYDSFASRRRNAVQLLALLEEIFASRTVDEWLSSLRAGGVPCGPVNSVEDALADPQTTARGMVVETDHPRFGRIKQVRSPVRVGAVTPEYRRAPARGESVGRLLGYDSSTVADLTSAGAFGTVA